MSCTNVTRTDIAPLRLYTERLRQLRTRPHPPAASGPHPPPPAHVPRRPDLISARRQVISLESILSLWRDLDQAQQRERLRSLAFTVYSQCKRTFTGAMSANSLTGFGPTACAEQRLKGREVRPPPTPAGLGTGVVGTAHRCLSGGGWAVGGRRGSSTY